MPLLKDGQLTEDIWTLLDETQVVPAQGAVMIDLERWQVERADLMGRNAPLGLRLLPGQSPDAIKQDVGQFAMIAIEFPAFTDGRGYSYARLLRERYGYTGELRAMGQVLRDQLKYMARVGFDTFEVDARITPEVFAAEMKTFSNVYQPSSDDAETIVSLRG